MKALVCPGANPERARGLYRQGPEGHRPRRVPRLWPSFGYTVCYKSQVTRTGIMRAAAAVTRTIAAAC